MLDFNFTLLTIFGIWCPNHWSRYRKITYRLYLLIVATIMFTLVSCQLARLLLVNLSFVEFNDTFYFFLSTSSGCFKLVANVVNHQKILQLLGLFQQQCCQAIDDFEENVKKTYDAHCRRLTLVLLISVELTILLWLVGQTIGGIESRQLPYKVLQPYDLSDSLVYWLSYSHHMIAGFLFGAISIITDATIAGFMLQLCAQLEILRHRLQRLPEMVKKRIVRDVEFAEKFVLTENVVYHVHLYNIAETIESTFNSIISVQFFLSSLQIGVSVYQLTARTAKIIDLLVNLFFVTRILGQLSTYCYFGNQVSAKSLQISDTLYNINWMPLSLSFKKCLTIMILRSSKSIEVSSGAIVHLSMATFTSVVKFAYSAFNFLKTTT